MRPVSRDGRHSTPWKRGPIPSFLSGAAARQSQERFTGAGIRLGRAAQGALALRSMKEKGDPFDGSPWKAQGLC